MKKNIRIMKYLVAPNDDDWRYIEMPEGSRILAVQEQYNKPALWTLSNAEESKTVRRAFRAFFTGKIYVGDPEELEYLGTVQLDLGTLVVHVFERKEVS